MRPKPPPLCKIRPVFTSPEIQPSRPIWSGWVFHYFLPQIIAESPSIIIAARRLEPKMDAAVST